MELSELISIASPDFLRRTYSLDIPSDSNSLESDLDVSVDAAQMLEYFDDYNILDDDVLKAVDSSNFKEGEILTPMILNNNSSLDSATMETISKPSDEFTTDLMTTIDSRVERKKTPKKPRRVQIKKLREAVELLTRQLEALNAGPPQELQEHFQLRHKDRPMWKHVAMRQYERRRKAEEYNATLREILEMQVQEAKCLQRILKRRSRIQMLENMLAMKRSKDVNNLPPPADNSQIFTKMLHELEENYLHVDSHFADKGVNALPCPGWKQERNSSAITGVVLEISQRNLLPFSLHTVKKSVWTILKGLETGDLKRIHDFNNMFKFHGQYSEESRDTITTSYFSASPGIEAVRGAQIRKVSRVYVEENRIVLIWKMLAEPKLEGSNAPAGYHIEMTLQMVMQQDEALTVCGGQSTHLMIHFSGLRRDLEIPVSSMFRGRGHHEICIALWENLISSIPVEIESVLIDSTCDAVDEVAQLQEDPIVSV